MARVLIIGIDAGTFDLIKPWAAAGQLPVLRRLLAEGSHAVMRSTVPAMSPPAWTSLLTGQNPGKHGIFDFLRREPGSYRLQTMRSNFTSYRTIFDILTSHDKTSIAVNVPMTYPPRPIKGTMVAGLVAPLGGKFTHPPELREELLAMGYRIDIAEEYRPGHEQSLIDDMRAVTRVQAEATQRLMRREEWSVAMVVFRAVDEAQSFLWHLMDPSHPLHDPELATRYGDAILEMHRLTDAIIGELVEAAGAETTTLVVSDHGGGPLHKEVFLNNWLQQQGLLVFKQQRESGWHRGLRGAGLTRERLSPLLSSPFGLKLRSKVPLGLQHLVLPAAAPSFNEAVDWSRTQAYSFGNIGQIYVNLKGREPAGIVAPGAEYEHLLDTLSAALQELRDPEDGLPVVDRVYRASEVYHGPHQLSGPDLNLIMRNMSYICHQRRELASSQIFAPADPNETGTHRPEGILIAHGPGIATGRMLVPCSLLDVAPTVLHLLGLPIPDDVDGSVLRELLADAEARRATQTVAAPEPQAQPQPEQADPDEEAEVLERLRALGYLE